MVAINVNVNELDPPTLVLRLDIPVSQVSYTLNTLHGWKIFTIPAQNSVWLFSICCPHLRGLVRDQGGEAGDRPPLSRVEENVVREHGSGGGGGPESRFPPAATTTMPSTSTGSDPAPQWS